MPVSDWTKEPDWDILFLDGEPVPGVAYVEAKLKSGLDVKKPRKQKKARITDEGVHPTELQIKLVLLPQEMAEFQSRIVPLLRPRAKNDERAKIAIAHPTAQLWGVDHVMVGDVRSNHPDPGDVFKVSFDCIEWRDPVKTKSKKKPEGNPATTSEIERRLIQERAAYLRGETFNPAKEDETMDEIYERIKPSRPENVQSNFSGRPAYLFPDPSTPKLQ